jgi:hypothetical protein
MNHTIKIGDIFVDEWGATMALVDFYQVVDIKGKSTIVLHEIDKEEKGTGYLSGEAKPIKDKFLRLDHNTKLLTRRVKISNHNNEPFVKIHDWNSFAYPHVEGKSYQYDHCD